MVKNVALSDQMIAKLEKIRKRFVKCSFTQAIEHLCRETTSPKVVIGSKWEEIKATIRSNYPENEKIKIWFASMEEYKGMILKEISDLERKEMIELYGAEVRE